jgi:hypothetical protein
MRPAVHVSFADLRSEWLGPQIDLGGVLDVMLQQFPPINLAIT